MRRILIISALLLVSLSPTLAGQSAQEALERRAVAGAINDVPDSPAQLAGVSYTLERSKNGLEKARIVKDEVTVTNTSARDIRQLIVVFTYKLGGGIGSVENRVSVGPLHAGEMRVAHSRTTINDVVDDADWTLTVTPTGAQYADGTYWAAPRDNRRPLLMSYLSQPDSHLQIREFNWTKQAYQVQLQVGNAKVVAYRLGVVKDTPDDFEVRLGEWVELNDEQINRHAMITDEANSLSAEQVFPREAYTVYSNRGQQGVTLGGVAIFVAELKFADGRTWQQPLARETLLWNN